MSRERPEGSEVYHRASGGRRVTAFGININPPAPRAAEESVMSRALKVGRWVVLIVALVAAGVLGFGWAFMLVVGGLNHEFGWLKPIGFGPALGIGAGTLFLLSMLRGSVNYNQTNTSGRS